MKNEKFEQTRFLPLIEFKKQTLEKPVYRIIKKYLAKLCPV
jgi:hypothetical protein